MPRVKTMQDLERLVVANEQSARDDVARFAAALTKNPCSALRHDAHIAIIAAARIEVCLVVKQVMDDGTLATVREYVADRLASLASSLTSRSTNHVANAYDDAQVANLAALLEQIGSAS